MSRNQCSYQQVACTARCGRCGLECLTATVLGLEETRSPPWIWRRFGGATLTLMPVVRIKGPIMLDLSCISLSSGLRLARCSSFFPFALSSSCRLCPRKLQAEACCGSRNEVAAPDTLQGPCTAVTDHNLS